MSAARHPENDPKRQPPAEPESVVPLDLADLLVPGETLMDKQKAPKNPTDEEPDAVKRPRRPQKLVLTDVQMKTVARTARAVREQYDQSDAPPLDDRLKIWGKLSERERIELRKLGVMWDNWARAILAEDEKLLVAKTAKENN